ncbi:UTP--glucose-1-phosphate uridylyltransferase [Oesophagostomum dentatum]|uniref:UTP--glucose-1-phosphate uridylyltransferase n=1 Tax=Oesophagostomum dentatum TaxID=61180 RepID=A0A0B1SMI5_OESDE|nr:UTP--glucose-1-phosphate uridylyltransferase [Oesophagostomum dentatum]
MHVSEEQKAELLAKLDEFFARTDQVTPAEANVFRQLYRQFLEETHYIDWNSWKFISENVQRNHSDLAEFDSNRKDVLDRLVVIKLNGGLGTTMGCDGPKSFIKVKEDLSFLDIARQQHEVFNKTHKCNVPLYLMNSFYTEEQTRKKLGSSSDVRTFCQSRCPRIWADSLLPVEGTGTNQE